MRIHLGALIAVAMSGIGLGTLPVAAQEPSAVGLWQQVDGDGKVSGWFIISEHGDQYEGAIAKMFMKPGEDPNPHCDKCDGDQKGAPWLGLTIIKGMVRKGLVYENGSILDPRNGTAWHAKMTLSPDGQELTVRGYVLFEGLGMDQHWNRLPDASLAQVDPALVAKLMPPAAPPARPNPAPKARTPAPGAPAAH